MKQLAQYFKFFLLVGLPIALQAQVPDAQYQIEAIIESVIEEMGEEYDATLLLEDLQGFAANPLNINTATRDELSRLHLLNIIQVEHLVAYREKYGPVLSIYELNAIDALHPEILKRMEPFVWFGPPDEERRKLSEILKYGRHELLLRSLGNLQAAEGYKEREDGTVPYEGNRFRYYSRYRFQSGNDISAGVIAEKDPGEAFFAGTNPHGFDFYSAHLSFKVSPFIQNITVGDFIVRSGQGLVVWQGFSMGKSLYALNISKTNQGIRPYTSTDENQYFRGISTALKAGDSRFSFFFSKKNRDGNLASSDSLGTWFTSLQSSGYHRTESEIADKKSVGDLNAGVLGSWQSGNLKLGAVFLYRHFALPFMPANQLYNRFYFRGTENYVSGADYLYSKGNYQLYGEAAVSKSGGKAVLQGVTAYLHDRIQLSSLFRHFDKDYHAIWAAPFSEGSSAANETGLYLGTHILPFKYVTLSAYSDVHRSEWIKYTTAGPSNGWDVFAQADFRPPGPFQVYIRYKNEEKDKKFLLNEKHVTQPEQFRKSRFHVQYNLSEAIVLKARFEHVQYKGLKTENGIMAYQDVQFSPVRFPLNLSARIAWFNTESYNTRIYAYENDLLYTFAIPAFYGEGFRTYMNLKYKLSEKAEVWVKMANTIQNNTESIGTGYNQIAGNQKTELKFQLRLKF